MPDNITPSSKNRRFNYKGFLEDKLQEIQLIISYDQERYPHVLEPRIATKTFKSGWHYNNNACINIPKPLDSNLEGQIAIRIEYTIRDKKKAYQKTIVATQDIPIKTWEESQKLVEILHIKSGEIALLPQNKEDKVIKVSRFIYQMRKPITILAETLKNKPFVLYNKKNPDHKNKPTIDVPRWFYAYENKKHENQLVRSSFTTKKTDLYPQSDDNIQSNHRVDQEENNDSIYSGMLLDEQSSVPSVSDGIFDINREEFPSDDSFFSNEFDMLSDNYQQNSLQSSDDFSLKDMSIFSNFFFKENNNKPYINNSEACFNARISGFEPEVQNMDIQTVSPDVLMLQSPLSPK